MRTKTKNPTFRRIAIVDPAGTEAATLNVAVLPDGETLQTDLEVVRFTRPGLAAAFRAWRATGRPNREKATDPLGALLLTAFHHGIKGGVA